MREKYMKINENHTFSFVSATQPQEEEGQVPSFPEDTREYAVDMRPYPIQELDGQQCECEYRHYTTFSGSDIVCVMDGGIVGELQALQYSLDENMEGDILLILTVFGYAVIPKDDTVVVAVFMNEYGDASYEVLRLLHRNGCAGGYSVDTVVRELCLRYHGKLLQPLVPVPEHLRKMSPEEFKTMVADAYTRWGDSHHLPSGGAESVKNATLDRVYFWIVPKMLEMEAKCGSADKEAV